MHSNQNIKHPIAFLIENYFFRLKHALLSWGDKFTPKEVADAFDAMDIDRNGLVVTEDLIQMLISGGDEE